MEIPLPYYALLFLLSPLLPLFLLHLLSSRGNSSNGGNPKPKPIPSPPGLPIFGHLHLLKKPLHRSLAALAARHGGDTGLLLLRFGKKPVVLVSSPAVAEECFTAHDVALADRPGLASGRLLTAGCPSIAMARYGPLWRALRRAATVHALCPRRLALSAPARDAEARAMATKLWRLATAGTGAMVGVKAAANEFVVNAIVAMAAGGRRMGEGEVRRFVEMTEAGMAAAGAANRQDFLPALRAVDFGRTARRLAGLAEERLAFGQRIIDEYKQSGAAGSLSEPRRRTLIGDLLRQQEQEPESCGDAVIRGTLLSMLQAGTDTSSSAIEWAMALLLNNPTSLAKATAEIDTVVGASRLLQERDLAVLPYLRGVVAETLRLYPAAPNLVPHEASSDCGIAGGKHVIPRGTMVLVDVYSMQRDPASWEDPEKFMPERFAGGEFDDVDAGGDGRRMMMMMPFGMGRRKCPGEVLAWRTVGVALGVMLQCLEWGRVGDEKVDMSEESGLTMHMAVPLVAMCRPRQEMGAVLRSLQTV
ncbi:isoflavone 3'-hydroxylase-like [Brachypodium distachyon]|uniref:Cytochrome P450 n=1 Tax=Brachypodium distachyon TaxID=15368 RepID=I1IH37_BRADI|nr:isoflavone 3'-hydroxylase-like [Brachypodium distachyon]KQJ86123.1 hypothetical protein BRADI_4g03430v3 [Brachypodium distachyon]|eukprot:XP_024318513.1 isoflavone 3'-hydroxylase-like [Brachypodium distachyon]